MGDPPIPQAHRPVEASVEARSRNLSSPIVLTMALLSTVCRVQAVPVTTSLSDGDRGGDGVFAVRARSLARFCFSVQQGRTAVRRRLMKVLRHPPPRRQGLWWQNVPGRLDRANPPAGLARCSLFVCSWQRPYSSSPTLLRYPIDPVSPPMSGPCPRPWAIVKELQNGISPCWPPPFRLVDLVLSGPQAQLGGYACQGKPGGPWPRVLGVY